MDMIISLFCDSVLVSKHDFREMRASAAVTSATGTPRTAADCGLALAQQRHRAGARAAGCRDQCAQLSSLREDCRELALQSNNNRLSS